MDASRSNIVCPMSSLIIQNTPSLPFDFIQVSKEYKEEILVQFFLEFIVEKKETFFKACSKPGSWLLNLPFPIMKKPSLF